MDCSLPGFSVHGVLQARILESVAIPFSSVCVCVCCVCVYACTHIYISIYTDDINVYTLILFKIILEFKNTLARVDKAILKVKSDQRVHALLV